MPAAFEAMALCPARKKGGRTGSSGSSAHMAVFSATQKIAACCAGWESTARDGEKKTGLRFASATWGRGRRALLAFDRSVGATRKVRAPRLTAG